MNIKITSLCDVLSAILNGNKPFHIILQCKIVNSSDLQVPSKNIFTENPYFFQQLTLS